MTNFYDFFNYETNRWEAIEITKSDKVETPVEPEKEIEPENEYFWDFDNSWAY